MVVEAPVGCARPGRPAAPGSLCRGHFSQLPALARSAGGSLRKSRTRTEVQAAAPDTSRPPHAAGRPSCWALTGSPAPRPRGTRQSGCTSRPPRPAPTAPLGPAPCRPSPPLLLGPKSQTPPVRLWGLLPALPVFPSGPQTPARLRSSGGLVLPGEASGLTCWAHRGEPQALPRPQLRAATLVPLTGPKRGPSPSPKAKAWEAWPLPLRTAGVGGVPVLLRARGGTWRGRRISTVGSVRTSPLVCGRGGRQSPRLHPLCVPLGPPAGLDGPHGPRTPYPGHWPPF